MVILPHHQTDWLKVCWVGNWIREVWYWESRWRRQCNMLVPGDNVLVTHNFLNSFFSLLFNCCFQAWGSSSNLLWCATVAKSPKVGCFAETKRPFLRSFVCLVSVTSLAIWSAFSLPSFFRKLGLHNLPSSFVDQCFKIVHCRESVVIWSLSKFFPSFSLLVPLFPCFLCQSVCLSVWLSVWLIFCQQLANLQVCFLSALAMRQLFVNFSLYSSCSNQSR